MIFSALVCLLSFLAGLPFLGEYIFSVYFLRDCYSRSQNSNRSRWRKGKISRRLIYHRLLEAVEIHISDCFSCSDQGEYGGLCPKRHIYHPIPLSPAFEIPDEI